MTWNDRDIFLRDGSLELNGYQVNFNNLGEGLFFFTHNIEGCYSTMAIEAREFLDISKRVPIPGGRASQDDCPGYCLNREVLKRCEVDCECAHVRDVMNKIKDMHKKGEIFNG